MPLIQPLWGDGQTPIESSTDPAAGGSTYSVGPTSLWLDTSQSPPVLYERNSGNTAWVRTDGSRGRHSETFTGSNGQTQYTLTYTPASISDIDINIDGWPQPNTNISNLSGKTLTFTALEADMIVTFTYTRLD